MDSTYIFSQPTFDDWLSDCLDSELVGIALESLKGKTSKTFVGRLSSHCTEDSLVWDGEPIATIKFYSSCESPPASSLRCLKKTQALLAWESQKEKEKKELRKRLESTISDYTVLEEKYRRASRKIQEVEKLKSNFLATISHELKTPLTSIIGYSEMLLEGMAGPLNKEQHSYSETVLKNADDLLQIVKGMLDVSLLESASTRIHTQNVDMDKVVDDVITSLSKNAKEKNITVRLESSQIPKVLADPKKLRQSVMHLLANAIKFSPDDTEVLLSLSVAAVHPEDILDVDNIETSSINEGRVGVLLTVEDQGPGIPLNVQDNVFQPFFQVDQGTTRRHGGAGLGLSLVKKYVDSHGGHVWLKSSEGMGAIFYMTLPVAESEFAKTGL